MISTFDSRLNSHAYVSGLFLKISGEFFRQGQPPPATLAMVAGGGGHIHGLILLLDLVVTFRRHYMWLLL